MKLKAILCGCAAALSLAAMATPATQAQDTTITSASSSLNVGVNKGTLIRLERSMSDVFVANQKIADVHGYPAAVKQSPRRRA